MYDRLSSCVKLPPVSTTCIDSDNRLKREAKGRIIYLSGILHESDEGAREKAAGRMKGMISSDMEDQYVWKPGIFIHRVTFFVDVIYSQYHVVKKNATGVFL